VRLSLLASLGIHAVLFGAFALGVAFWRSPASLISDKGEPIALTVIAAPDDPMVEPHSAKQTISVPPAPPKAAEPLVVKLPQPLPILPVPAETLVPKIVQLPSLSIETAEEQPAFIASPQPRLATAAPQSATSDPTPLPTRSSGDSSLQPVKDDAAPPVKLGARIQPYYHKNPEPLYPVFAVRHHQEGLVVLRVVVSPLGRATHLELKKTSGFPLLDEAAIKAVRDWEFEPARIGPIAVESEIEVPVRFALSH
jgi:protein TonB